MTWDVQHWIYQRQINEIKESRIELMECDKCASNKERYVRTRNRLPKSKLYSVINTYIDKENHKRYTDDIMICSKNFIDNNRT